jgi:uncharacterized membrane protein YccC
MKNMITAFKKMPLMWTEALRALICMAPMLTLSGLGKTTYLVSLGQGGFLYSWLFLPPKLKGRLIMGVILTGMGLAFYLVGGNVVQHPVLAIFFTFLVCLNLSFLSGWSIGGPLALTLIMIFTAGLNTGSSEKAAKNFVAFAFVLTWSALISLLPFWKPFPPPPVNKDLTDLDLAEQGFRIGIGSSIALAISYAAGFAKLGWAPSAVGNVVRFDENLSKKRAWGRFLGTVGGALLASLALAFVSSLTVLVWIGALSGVLNGLFKKTKVGLIPLFYTATILILYSANDLATGKSTILNRVFYNLVGIAIGLIIVIYPFPRITKRINPKTKLA